MRFFNILPVFIIILISKSFQCYRYYGYQTNVEVITRCFCRDEDVELKIKDYYRGKVYDSIEDECGSTRTLVVYEGWHYSGGELYIRVNHRNCSNKREYSFYLYEKCKVHYANNFFDYWTCKDKL